MTLSPLWTPSPDRIARAALTRFLAAAARASGRPLSSYWPLHQWSIDEPAAFWAFLADDSGLPFTGTPRTVLSTDPMPGTRWFYGVRVNYADALLNPPSGSAPGTPAIIALDETGLERSITWPELRREVARAAAALRRDGVEPGDRVAAFVANVPEAVVLLLACASLGAIFTSCSPDFGLDAAHARFHQVQPRLLLASTRYSYNGKPFETAHVLTGLMDRITPRPTLVTLGGPPPSGLDGRASGWSDWLDKDAAEPSYAPLPFDHPLYILYSSGTTGLPKAMVHRAGGALLMHHKEQRLHGDVGPGDRLLYFTTCGWMMWNWLVSALAQGATIVLYEGSPSHPSLETLWRLADRLGVTHFGTSPRFLNACKAAGAVPREFVSLDALRTVFSTGSPLSPAGFEWVYESVKADLHLASISGGTDIVGCFMLGVPTEPVYAGQIQAPGLGVDLAAYDDAGRPVAGQPGELVIRQPLPSMPLRFWNDEDGARYRDAYFAHYPGVWRHGDLVEITPQRGIIVYGRSDATLNPGGVRIGTAEIYRALESVPEVVESLAVGRREEEDEVIWLFVVLRPGERLDAALNERIVRVIRTHESPRHVPRRILQVSQLPRTRSGKSMELAVGRVVNGQSVPNREAAANPEALDEIARLAGL